MRKLILITALFCGFSSLFAQQDLKIQKLEATNASDEINDGRAELEVTGGQPPYRYYWSIETVDTAATVANNLIEGNTHSVTVRDATGAEVSRKFKVKTQSLAEGFNSTFRPIVTAFTNVIFWDPFYALGLYDNKVYDEAGNVDKHPNGTIRTNQIPFIVIWLVFGALFFTLRMGFIQFWGWRHSINLVRGKYNDDKAPGEVTHFQALATAVSATVGLGNIAGVAVAISIGGPGATFWLIVAGSLRYGFKIHGMHPGC
ncbi:MAG: alanine:cation symporter family protein [Owenweeksia sp.]|nr:alanine:cation symporter family protein [Owenweeksia sp.]